MVPDGWEIKPLGEVCELINGRGFKPHEWSTEGYPIIRIQNLNGSGEFNHFNGDFNPKILVKPGQLLFAWSGSRGTSFGPHVWHGPDAVLNYHTWKIVTKTGTDPEFLRQLFEHITTEIENSAHGAAALVHVQKADMEKRKLLLPALRQQKKIAEILSTWDKAIETTEKLLANAEAQKRALMQQLLTGKRRLKGFEGGEWRVRRLDAVATIRKGQQKSKMTLLEQGNYPVINGGVEPSGYTDEWNSDAGTITISEGGNSCGFVNLIKQPFWSGGHCYTLENIRVRRDFLFHCLKFKEAEIMKLRVGSGLPNIQKRSISAVSVVIPTDREQRQIEEILNDVSFVTTAISNDMRKLCIEKRALMQQLLTGKKRVTV